MSLETSFYYTSKDSGYYLAVNVTDEDMVEVELGSMVSKLSSFAIPLSLLAEVLGSIRKNDALDKVISALDLDADEKANLLMAIQRI